LPEFSNLFCRLLQLQDYSKDAHQKAVRKRKQEKESSNEHEYSGYFKILINLMEVEQEHCGED